MIRLPASAGLLVAAAFLAACGRGDPTWRTYEELVTDPPAHHHTGHASHGELRWTTPDGWTEAPGSGMRLASFTVTGEGGEGLCTIVILGTSAGMLDANVRRWINQLDFDDPSPEELAAFLARQERFRTEAGWEGVLVDLTAWRDQPPERESTIGAMIPAEEATIFLKFTGSVALLQANQDAFARLCRSLRMEE